MERDRIIRELDAVQDSGDAARSRVRHLETKFNEILVRFKAPAFGEEEGCSIDRKTHLPIYHGRRFDTLSSPGLATLVTVAYTLAHHVTALELGLKLPSFLIVDGLSEHLGTEGLDPARLKAVYEYLIELSQNLADDLQIIVVDHEVPAIARPFVRLALTETDRLIPDTAREEA